MFPDPQTGKDEALGRASNALFLTAGLAEKGQQVALILQGAGTRWPRVLAQPSHPGRAARTALRPWVGGICGACADVFGAAEPAAATGLPMVRERAIPGVGQILDVSRHRDDGYRAITY